MPYTLKDPVRHKFTKKSYNVRTVQSVMKRLSQYFYCTIDENKFSVDEMKGIVTNVATHRGDIEKMVEKIIEVGWLVTNDLCDIRVIIDF